MNTNHWAWCCVLFLGLGQTATADIEEPEAVPLWPGVAPGCEGLKNEEKFENRGAQQNALGLNRSISRVTVPTVAIYKAEGDSQSGAAVVICPGGGYGRVVIDKEGHDVARLLQAAGVTGVVLKYRNPRPDLSGEGEPWPLQDVKRAIQMVRHEADKLGVRAERIGVMGFSAGGHLASSASVHYDEAKDDAEDILEGVSSRPDFSALIYPVVSFADGVAHAGSRVTLLGKDAPGEMVRKFSNELQVNKDTPPAFLAHAKDDGVKVENSILYAKALKGHEVPCEIHLFDKGGHGFGIGIDGGEPAEWPGLFLKWLESLD